MARVCVTAILALPSMKQASNQAPRAMASTIEKRRIQLSQGPWAPVVCYFRAVETVVKVPLSVVPSVPTTVMIATAIPAAIRPYSIAVAPDSFARKFLNMFVARPSADEP